MFNWSEIEEISRLRSEQQSQRLSADVLARLELQAELDAARKPLKARLAHTLVRIGARLDPGTVTIHRPISDHDVLVEGPLSAYLR
jgi:hypothetical protein